jgi:hemoglobin
MDARHLRRIGEPQRSNEPHRVSPSLDTTAGLPGPTIGLSDEDASRALEWSIFAQRPSVYDVAGREEGFLALAAAHHARCLADPVLSHPFSHGGRPDHVQRLASYWAEVFGGPPNYSERYGGQSDVMVIHAGTDAEEDLGLRFVACFVAAADDAALSRDAEFRRVLRSYMEWAVADVHSFAPKGSKVPHQLAIPRWSWDGLVSGPAPVK